MRFPYDVCQLYECAVEELMEMRSTSVLNKCLFIILVLHKGLIRILVRRQLLRDLHGYPGRLIHFLLFAPHPRAESNPHRSSLRERPCSQFIMPSAQDARNMLSRCRNCLIIMPAVLKGSSSRSVKCPGTKRQPVHLVTRTAL
jgi:hypothetical protein